MFKRRALLMILWTLPVTACPAVAREPASDARQEVEAVERAFAQTMADRDFEAFTSFLAEDAVFLGGGALRGKAEVSEGWRRYCE